MTFEITPPESVDQPPEVPMVNIIVTCDVPECKNYNIGIPICVPNGPNLIYCNCGHAITNVAMAE